METNKDIQGLSAKEIYEFEIHRNAEGSVLAYASVKGDGNGYRIAGPKAWGGSKCLARVEISQRDLVEFVRCYAKGALAELAPQQPDSERDAARWRAYRVSAAAAMAGLYSEALYDAVDKLVTAMTAQQSEKDK